MKIILVTMALFCGMILVDAETNKDLYSRVDVIAVANLTEYLDMTNQSVAATPMKKSELNRAQIRYTLGRRVSGDRVVATNAANQQWASPQDVSLTLSYPRSGVGNIVSFVDILVDQSSSVGQGYIVAGGIDQRRITVVIQAYTTVRFNYTASIFGY